MTSCATGIDCGPPAAISQRSLRGSPSLLGRVVGAVLGLRKRVPATFSFFPHRRIAVPTNLLSSALDQVTRSLRQRMKHKLFGLLRRIGLLILVVWTVVSLVTILIELVPGDPAVAVLGEQATPEQLAQFRAKHGLDRPPFFVGFPADERGQRHF